MSENLLKEETKPEKSLIEEQPAVKEELKAPDKFLDKETGEVNVKALLKSYLELEKKLSEKTNNSPVIPASIDEYEITCNHNYFESDDELNKKLLESGFTKEQAQLVYDLAEERMIPMIIEIASCFECDKEKARLEEKFGGKEKWKEVSRQLLQYAKNKLPEQVIKGLSSSYDGVIALYNMMIEDAPAMSVPDEVEGSLPPEELHKMMQDKRYWQERNPEFISKVTEGFKKLYS